MTKEQAPERSVKLKWRLVGLLGKLIIDFLFMTSIIRFQGYEQVRDLMKTRRFILAFWHSRILLVSFLFKGWKAAIMVSASEDGEYIAQVLERQGHDCVRGSSTRHGARAMTGMLERMNNGQPAGIVPDGPQGPRQKVQPGVIALSARTGFPIVPITYSVKRRKVFGSWDRFILPFPFNSVTVAYGKPVEPPQDEDREDFEARRLELENELNRITAEADAVYGHEDNS